MTSRRPDDDEPADELEGLLERHALGELEPTGWRRLGEIIRGDRKAALRYVQSAHDGETLRDETSGGAAVGRPADAPSAPTPKETIRHGGGWSLASVLPWGLAVSAAFLAGWGFSITGRSPQGATHAVPARPPFVLAEAGTNKPLGRITGLTPVASSDGLLRPLKVGSSLGRGEVFQLTRGAARLEIGGGEILVQGPAELSAIDTHKVFLRRGRIAVSHPDQFTIQTPVAVATGLGGGFTVVAEANDHTIVTAQRGEVVANAAPGPDEAVEDCPLAAGETLSFTHDGESAVAVRPVDSAPEGLLLAWQETAEGLHAYERLVLSDGPLAYWPLYRVRRHRAVLDLTQNGFDGYAIGNWPTELSDVHASQPRGAYFDGESYVESDRKPPVDLRSGFTIESWARVVGGPEYQAVFTSRWVLESNTEHEQCFGFTIYAGENDRWQCWTGSGEYGRNWDQLHAPTPMARDRWTHVTASFEPDPGQEDAAQAIAGVVRLYVDGEAVAEARHSLSLEDFEWPARIGAAEFVPKSLTSWLFQGELRDVAVYDHVLSADRIQTHAEQGRSAT